MTFWSKAQGSSNDHLSTTEINISCFKRHKAPKYTYKQAEDAKNFGKKLSYFLNSWSCCVVFEKKSQINLRKKIIEKEFSRVVPRGKINSFSQDREDIINKIKAN